MLETIIIVVVFGYIYIASFVRFMNDLNEENKERKK